MSDLATMTEDDNAIFMRAAIDVLREETQQQLDEFADKNTPAAHKVVHEYPGPKIDNIIQTEPLAQALDRMTYEMARVPKPEAHFDTQPLVDMFQGIVEVISMLKEENAEHRKAITAQNQVLSQLVTALNAQKATPNQFSPTINAPESPTALAAISELRDIVTKLVRAMETKPKQKNLRVIHGEKESKFVWE